MKSTEVPPAAMGEIRAFLARQGLSFLRGRFTGYSTGGLALSGRDEKGTVNYEAYTVVCHPVGKPKEAISRLIERPTKPGAKIQWANYAQNRCG